jgi:chemotaxis protein histidine kinase CheA
MSNKTTRVSYDLDTKFISAARKLKAAPKTNEGDFAKAFEKAGNFGDKLNVIGKFAIGRTDLYSVILDINKDIKADLEDADNVKRLIQSLYVSALINFKFVPKIHEELRGYVPIEFQILERQIHQLVAAIIDGKDEVEETADEADQAPEEEIGAEKQEESLFAQMLGNAADKVEKVAKKAKDKVKAKADKKEDVKKDAKKEEKVETKTEAKPEVNVNPVQPVVEDEKAQRPATDANNTFYQTLKELEAVALQREAYHFANHSPMDNNANREIAYQQYANQFGVDPILIPEYRLYLNQFLNPQESAMFFADVQQPGYYNPQQPMYQSQPQPMVNQQPVAPAQATISTMVPQDVQPAQAPQQPVPADAPQATISTMEQVKTESESVKDKVVKEKLETSDHDLAECVAKYLGYSSYKHFMNTFLDANALKRKAKINKLVDTDKVILNFTYLIRDMITKGGNTVIADAILKGGRFRVSGIQMVDKTPFVVLRNNKMVLEINALDYLKRGNVIVFRINAQGKDAWYWMRLATGEMGQYNIHQQPAQPQQQTA